MLVLGIETATSTCAVALWDGQLVGEIRYKLRARHAEIIAGMARELVQQSNYSFEALEGVAVSLGPGSFTGLRIGMAIAKGMAFAQDIPIAGIHTPDAIAAIIPPPASQIIIAMPSRRGEIYAARYRLLDDVFQREGQIEAVELKSLREWAGEIDLIAGPGMQAVMQANVKGFRFLPEQFWEMTATSVARLGARKLISGECDDLAALEPAYVKAVYTTSPAC